MKKELKNTAFLVYFIIAIAAILCDVAYIGYVIAKAVMLTTGNATVGAAFDIVAYVAIGLNGITAVGTIVYLSLKRAKKL